MTLAVDLEVEQLRKLNPLQTIEIPEKDSIHISGKVDYLLSAGEQDAEVPYFCLHEYKREKGTHSDPLGQLLIAMMAAQKINPSGMPVLGTYVLGRFWFFVFMKEDQYMVSTSYDASKDEIFEIYKILKKTKVFLEKQSTSFDL